MGGVGRPLYRLVLRVALLVHYWVGHPFAPLSSSLQFDTLILSVSMVREHRSTGLIFAWYGGYQDTWA